MSKPIVRVGLVGCGHWGKNYLRVLHEHPGVEVVGVADPSEAAQLRILATQPGTPVFTSHMDLLDQGQCDALIVATIASQHTRIIHDAFEAGVDVLAEKPVTLTVEDADMLCAKAQQENCIFMTAHTFLFNPSVQKIKTLLQQGVAGDLYYIKSRRTHLGLIRSDVNAVWDLAPHDISMFMYLLDECPCEVQAMGRRFLRSSREDVAFINLRFPSGVVANIQVSWADANKERVLDLVGSKSRIVFDDINMQEPVRIFQKGVAVEDDQAKTFGEFKYLFRDGDILSPKIPMQEPLRILCDAFLDSVHTRVPPYSDGNFGREVVKVLCRIDEALGKGNPE